MGEAVPETTSHNERALFLIVFNYSATYVPLMKWPYKLCD